MDIKKIEAIIEALLFASGDILEIDKISEILEIEKEDLKFIVSDMGKKFTDGDRGIMIREINNGYQLCTKPDFEKYVKKVFELKQKQGLSQAAFETLSIIAYNQPITKAKIEQIRGVNSDSSVTRLLERNLITYAGRLETPGRPMLFSTTDEFLRQFGLRNIKDLPNIEFNTIESEEENEEAQIHNDIVDSEK